MTGALRRWEVSVYDAESYTYSTRAKGGISASSWVSLLLSFLFVAFGYKVAPFVVASGVRSTRSIRSIILHVNRRARKRLLILRTLSRMECSFSRRSKWTSSSYQSYQSYQPRPVSIRRWRLPSTSCFLRNGFQLCNWNNAFPRERFRPWRTSLSLLHVSFVVHRPCIQRRRASTRRAIQSIEFLTLRRCTDRSLALLFSKWSLDPPQTRRTRS